MTKVPHQQRVADAMPEELLAEATDHPVDRPGCDFGGSTGLTTAGLGIGLGQDASDTRLERSLPGRRFRGTLAIPRWRGPDVS